jgi:23S rRNA (pseudouridine1915-N3)-methyltransferase
MPGWIETGYREYASRLPSECALHLVEIDPGRRGKGTNPSVAKRLEGERMLAALPPGARVIALDAAGQAWSTERLAGVLGRWMSEGRDLALLAGGPEGLSDACLARADGDWSLSPLTFPHPLVRVIVAEQLYRAWSILRGHPYHRA